MFFGCLGAQEMVEGSSLGPIEMCSSREVDISTTPIRAHKPFCVSSSGVRVLDFVYVKKALGASL
jgi:hypothetical protein